MNYKRRFRTGILSSWENYIKHVVSHYIQFVYIQFFLVILYYFVTFFYHLFITKLHIYNLQESKCLWIHHWVVLQFLHKHFVVGYPATPFNLLLGFRFLVHIPGQSIEPSQRVSVDLIVFHYLNPCFLNNFFNCTKFLCCIMVLYNISICNNPIQVLYDIGARYTYRVICVELDF